MLNKYVKLEREINDVQNTEEDIIKLTVTLAIGKIQHGSSECLQELELKKTLPVIQKGCCTHTILNDVFIL
jgi:uncharacterized protein YuzB (UPF0349 family)